MREEVRLKREGLIENLFKETLSFRRRVFKSSLNRNPLRAFLYNILKHIRDRHRKITV